MAEATKYVPIGVGGNNLNSDIKSLFSILKTRKKHAFAYAFMLSFVAFTVFLAFCPSPNSSSPWFTNMFSPTSSTTSTTGTSSFFSFFFPNTTSSSYFSSSSSPPPPYFANTSRSSNNTSPKTLKATPFGKNKTQTTPNPSKDAVQSPNQTSNHTNESPSVVNKVPLGVNNHTQVSGTSDEATKDVKKTNQTAATATAPAPPKVSVASPNQNLSSSVKGGRVEKGVVAGNSTASVEKKQGNGNNDSKVKHDMMMESLMKCDFFDGEWVKDDSYPLYKPGSCNLVDEQFNCINNGRPDRDYQKYKWKPKGCTLPRLDGHKMLDLLRGKRLVFVGDSINRNMWESLICILRNSVKNKKKVYEANGRVHFRGEASYSFIFKDYNFSVELYVSPFLVQEWEVPGKNGAKKETLRLDLVGRSSDQYKDADIIIFNTGHWWTHDKTSKGKDYYQEGSHVYDELNVLEAFRKAMTTWSRWVDANINPSKSMVFFRGYSASHFSGGQWNSGGQCDSETVPIKNEKYLREYPPKMRVMEKVLKYMKTQVSYLNVTKMTDFRKDGHPSIYRKQNLSPEERKSPLMYQDCSHWCLPGVPDTWNEILYAELLMKQYQNQNQQKRP